MEQTRPALPGFSSIRPKVDGFAGVYVLLLRGTVVYAGRSTNVIARCNQHFNRMCREFGGKGPIKSQGIRQKAERQFIQFDEIRYKLLPIEECELAELELIQQFQPEGNRLLNRPKVDIMKTSAFRTLMAKSRRPVLAKLMDKDLKGSRDHRSNVLPSMTRMKHLEDDGL